LRVDLTEFKQAIQDTFYDKEVLVYSSELIQDPELFTRLSVSEQQVDSFLGNVSFDSFDTIQESYGIKESFDIAITTDKSLSNETIIGYQGKYYKVSRVFAEDTHFLIIAKKWLSRSSTSISA